MSVNFNNFYTNIETKTGQGPGNDTGSIMADIGNLLGGKPIPEITMPKTYAPVIGEKNESSYSRIKELSGVSYTALELYYSVEHQEGNVAFMDELADRARAEEASLIKYKPQGEKDEDGNLIAPDAKNRFEESMTFYQKTKEQRVANLDEYKSLIAAPENFGIKVLHEAAAKTYAGAPASEVYADFKNSINEAKNDPVQLKSIVSFMLAKSADNYEKKIMEDKQTGTGAIAGSQEEILQKFMSADDKTEVDNAICGTIHGFMATALAECGIEAAVINGTTDNGPHYTLAYKTGEGQYVFNDYDKSYNVSADNISQATQKAHKGGFTNQSNGFVKIVTNEHSFTQYELADVAAYGGDIDKYSDVMEGAFRQEQVQADGLYLNVSDDVAGGAGTIRMGVKDGNSEKSMEAKVTGETDSAYSGISIGAQQKFRQEFSMGQTNFTTSETFTESVTQLKQGDSEAPDNRTFFTLAGEADIKAERTIFDDGSGGTLNLGAKASAKLAAVFNPDTAASIDDIADKPVALGMGLMGDGGAKALVGADYTKVFSDATLNVNAGGGVLSSIDHSYVNDSIGRNPNLGWQANGNMSLTSNNTQGFVWGVGAQGAFMEDQTQSRTEASANLFLGSINPESTSWMAKLNAGYESQTIHNGFNESLKNNLNISGTFAATFNNGWGAFAGISEKVNVSNGSFELRPPDATIGLRWQH